MQSDQIGHMELSRSFWTYKDLFHVPESHGLFYRSFLLLMSGMQSLWCVGEIFCYYLFVGFHHLPPISPFSPSQVSSLKPSNVPTNSPVNSLHYHHHHYAVCIHIYAQTYINIACWVNYGCLCVNGCKVDHSSLENE